MGLNFFSLVLSLVKVPEAERSEYLLSKVCSSSSDHFLRFIFGGCSALSWTSRFCSDYRALLLQAGLTRKTGWVSPK